MKARNTVAHRNTMAADWWGVMTLDKSIPSKTRPEIKCCTLRRKWSLTCRVGRADSVAPLVRRPKHPVNRAWNRRTVTMAAAALVKKKVDMV